MPAPKEVSEVHSFIGMCGFYRNYVSSFSMICGTLNDLTKEGVNFRLEEIEQRAFDNLKQSIISAPILRHPNFNYSLIIETDASDKGLEAVLIQRYNNQSSTIQYVTRTLSAL